MSKGYDDLKQFNREEMDKELDHFAERDFPVSTTAEGAKSVPAGDIRTLLQHLKWEYLSDSIQTGKLIWEDDWKYIYLKSWLVWIKQLYRNLYSPDLISIRKLWFKYKENPDFPVLQMDIAELKDTQQAFKHILENLFRSLEGQSSVENRPYEITCYLCVLTGYPYDKWTGYQYDKYAIFQDESAELRLVQFRNYLNTPEEQLTPAQRKARKKAVETLQNELESQVKRFPKRYSDLTEKMSNNGMSVEQFMANFCENPSDSFYGFPTS